MWGEQYGKIWAFEMVSLSKNQEFYAQVYETARELGYAPVQAEFAATQAVLESRGGSSGLARDHNNLFGMKVGSSWTGPSVNMKTGEEYGGKRVTEKANFRVYDSPRKSIVDYFERLKTRWPETYKAKTWEEAIAGLNLGITGKQYATDSRYAGKVTDVAKQYAPAKYIAERRVDNIYGANPVPTSAPRPGIDGQRIGYNPVWDQYGNKAALPQSGQAARLADQYSKYQQSLGAMAQPRNVPVPTPRPDPVTALGRATGSVAESPRAALSGSANVPNMLSGPAAIREREERGVYANLRGTDLNYQDRQNHWVADVMAAVGSPTINPPEGSKKSDRVTFLQADKLAKVIANYARNPTPQALETIRSAMNGSAYSPQEKLAALHEANFQINTQDTLAGAVSKAFGKTGGGKSFEDRARQYTAQIAALNEVAAINNEISKIYSDPRNLIFNKEMETRPEMAAFGASMFPDAFAGLYGPDRRATGWGLMAPPTPKGPALPSDPRLGMAVGSLPKGPTFAAPAPPVNPREIARMQDNLRNQMAFRSPNQSNMNVSGYGFATPARPSQAPNPGRGNINPPNVVSPPANVLSNFDQYGNFIGNRQSSVAPISDFRSSLAERAAVPQRSISAPNQTAFAPGPTTSRSVQQAQAGLAKSNARDQFARDIMKGMPVEVAPAKPAGPSVSDLAKQYSAYGNRTAAPLDAIDIPNSARPADQSQRFAPMPSNRPATQAVPAAPAVQPQVSAPRSPNISVPGPVSVPTPQSITDAAKSRFDAARPGVFQGIPPQDIYDQNAPGRSGFRGFGAGGFLGNLLTGNLRNMGGIERTGSLPGILGVIQNAVQGIRNPQQQQQATQQAAQAVQTVAPALGQVMGLPAAQAAAKAGNNMVIGRDAQGILGWMADGGLSAGAANAGWMSNNPERYYGGYGGGYDPTPT
jgi:hypothetical protein